MESFYTLYQNLTPLFIGFVNIKKVRFAHFQRVYLCSNTWVKKVWISSPSNPSSLTYVFTYYLPNLVVALEHLDELIT